MSTYSQYSTSNFTDSGGDVWTYNGISSDAARYSIENIAALSIAFELNTNAPGPVHVWRDDGTAYPATFSHSSSGPWNSSVSDAQTIYMKADDGSNIRSFTSPHWQYASTGQAGQPGQPGTVKKVFCNFW